MNDTYFRKKTESMPRMKKKNEKKNDESFIEWSEMKRFIVRSKLKV